MIGIGLNLERFKVIGRRLAFDNFSDGTTFMTLGIIDGVLSLWYTKTEEVIMQWSKEE